MITHSCFNVSNIFYLYHSRAYQLIELSLQFGAVIFFKGFEANDLYDVITVKRIKNWGLFLTTHFLLLLVAEFMIQLTLNRNYMPVRQKYMIKYWIQTKSEPLISIPKIESESDEPFESYFEFSEKFRKYYCFFLKRRLISCITFERIV